MRVLVCLIATLFTTLPAWAEGPQRARFLDPEEMMSGLPEVSSGIVYRVPASTVLMMEAGAGIGVDFSVTLIADPGTPVEQFFLTAGETSGGKPRSVAMITVMIGNLIYAEVAECAPSNMEEGVLTCSTDRSGGSFDIDMALAPPNLALTIAQPFSVSDDPTYTKAGKKTLVPAPDDEAWTIIVPPVE